MCTVMARSVIVFVIFGFILHVGCSTNYDNHTLIRLYPTSEDKIDAVVGFQDPTGGVEVLKPSRGVNDTLDILVAPGSLKFVEQYAHNKGLTLEVKQPNYGRILEAPERTPRRRTMGRGFDLYSYNSYADILAFTEVIARQYPKIVTLEDVGKSYQGRKIKLVKLSTDPNAGNPVIFIDAGIHSREWAAPAMAMYLIHRIASDIKSTGPGGILNGVDWYILPVVNPDGYEYTRASPSNRMWRKTRSKNSNCYGVDGNRNYGFKWAVSGVSHDPCHMETYAGPRPFSEPETQIVRNIMMDNAKMLKLYVSLHSYGQYLVYPWGFTGDYVPKSWKNLDAMAKAVSASVEKAGGKPFTVLMAGKWYPAAGGSDDFAFGAVGVPYSYTMELTNGYEFSFPAYLLRTVLPQFYAGFQTFADRIRNEFGKL